MVEVRPCALRVETARIRSIAFEAPGVLSSDRPARSASGSPGYRNTILRSGERVANDIMRICCSGAKTERLTLDL
jgi:hypothetical protein